MIVITHQASDEVSKLSVFLSFKKDHIFVDWTCACGITENQIRNISLMRALALTKSETVIVEFRDLLYAVLASSVCKNIQKFK